MNWAIKMAAKVVLSRVPLSYDTFRSMGMFRHGHMNKLDYAIGVFSKHADRVGGVSTFSGRTCLELGPGDSLASAILARAAGARKTYLVDVGNFVEANMPFYRELISELQRRGYAVSDLTSICSVGELLEKTGAEYLTDGVRSLKTIPSGSVDVIWSQAVLEHIRVHEVPEALREMRRILSDSGIMSHRIDYKDHLGGSLNNLRFSSRVWEAEAMARSGFYTNRIRNSEFLRLIEDAGFHLQQAETARWDKAPIPRSKLAKEFQSLSEDDLRTRNVDVVATVARSENRLNYR